MLHCLFPSAAANGFCRVDHTLPTVAETVLRTRPTDPMICFRPSVLEATARRFVTAFPGRVLYAVKCNPDPTVLRALHAGGVNHFDVASLAEIEQVRQAVPAATLAFMHPVKARPAIRAAYREHGVRDFALDSLDELNKIVEETGGAEDLGLHVRLRLPKAGGVLYDLSGKFGAAPDDAVALLRAARQAARRLGLCFHVGSQCLDPGAYERALEVAGAVLAAAGVRLDTLDVGGGFPVSYPDVTPPPLADFIAAIERGIAAIERGRARLGLPDCVLWCEPGRALVASGASLVVQVQLRRGNELFINDGVYGTLSDAGAPGFRFPARLIRPDEGGLDAGGPDSGGPEAVAANDDPGVPLRPFAFFGPTCDSADRMAGPFLLPDDVREGDWIEIGQLGAYAACLRTRFNGFDRLRRALVADLPLLPTPGYDLPPVRAAGADGAPARHFFFGSLMDRDHLERVLGRGTGDLTFTPATILGFRRRRARGESFPILVPHPGGQVEGLVVEGLTPADVDRLEFFETGDYALEGFEVVTGAGRVGARVFISTGHLEDSGEGWDLDAWRRTEKTLSLVVAEELMAHYGVTPRERVEALWPEIKKRALSRLLGSGRRRRQRQRARQAMAAAAD